MKLPSLNLQILIGAIAGLGLGCYFHVLGAEHETVKLGLYSASLVATLFIDLLKMILIPLVFYSLKQALSPVNDNNVDKNQNIILWSKA